MDILNNALENCLPEEDIEEFEYYLDMQEYYLDMQKGNQAYDEDVAPEEMTWE